MSKTTRQRARRRTAGPAAARPGTPTRPGRLWLLRSITIGGAVLAALVIGEIIVRVFDLGPQIVPVYARNFRLSDDPVLRYELLPGSEYQGGTINSDGMRDREYAVQKPADVFRIACLGDSICFGYDVQSEETFAGRLEAYLNRYYGSPARRFEVLNFGVMGYNITQVVRNLRVRALKYDPDLIVYAYAVNDPQAFSVELDALRRASRLAAHSRLYLITRALLKARSAARSPADATADDPEWSSLWAGSYERYYTDLHRSGPGWERVVAGFTQLGEISDARQIPTYVVIFPVLRDFSAYPLRDVHRKVAAAARDRGLAVLDMFPPYLTLAQTPGARFARDFLHPDAAGYAYAALVMLRELLIRADLPLPASDIQAIASQDALEGRLARLLLQRFPSPPADPRPQPAERP